MAKDDDPASGSFHIDKRVPVALIITLIAQTAGIVWWAASISAAQGQALIDAKRMEMRVDRIEAERDDIKTRVIRIEEKIGNQNDTLREILRSVQRTGEPGDQR